MPIMNNYEEPLLVADIGGTNARFALADWRGKELSQPLNLLVSDYSDIIPACREYLDRIKGTHPSRACIAVACPVWGDRVSLTNNNWSFSIKAVQHALNLKHLMVVNDFKALAAGVPLLGEEERTQIGSGTAMPGRPVSVIGPGTGLGVATVAQVGNNRFVFDGEGGHVGFAPGNDREIEILQVLLKQYGRVSAERILCGEGIRVLFKTLSMIDDVKVPDLEAADIVELANSGSNARCLETINIFCSALGSFAGDTAMTMSSQGGVYIGGGIVPRISKLLEQSAFRERFEAKGRTSPFIKNLPTFLITTTHTALSGAASLLSESLSSCSEQKAKLPV